MPILYTGGVMAEIKTNKFPHRGLYAILDDQVHLEYGIEKLLQQIVLESAIPVIQLRLKKIMTSKKIELIRKAVKLKETRPYCLIVNDDIELITQQGVNGLHLGQTDIAFSLARKLYPAHHLGLSTHNLDQVRQGRLLEASYIGCGAVFETTTKRNTECIGISGLNEIVKTVLIPKVAIGGINYENIADVAATGCEMAAVISALVHQNKFCGQDLHERFLKNSNA